MGGGNGTGSTGTEGAIRHGAVPTPRFLPFGDAALIVEFGREKDRALSAAVLALDAAVAAAKLPGITETAPSFRSLLVQFDPLATEAASIEAAILDLLPRLAPGAAGQPRLWTLPACYEGPLAPDLASVAERAGLTPAAVVDRHAAIEHHVYMIGFLPGAPYMGDLPGEIDLPRRRDPRTAVPAGSVAIAVGLTVIYPFESPGGWHLIGRTPAALFGAHGAPGRPDAPVLLTPGDAVRFEPVGGAAYAAIEQAAAAGDWVPEWRPRLPQAPQ
ncbi:MAG: 5-oxoprolinase subunit PxpB [Pseudomonadota bacterium]